jgi:single-strand DNA-binding protein
MSVNKCLFIGNLGEDPSLRYMPNGDAVVNISIACSERYKDKNTGEQKESTEWIRAVAFRKQAEVIAEYFKKGSKIYIEGKMRTRSYDKDGVKHYTTEIMINEFDFLDRRNDAQQGNQQPRQSTQQRPSQAAAPSYEDLEDIPFADTPKLLAKHHLI